MVPNTIDNGIDLTGSLKTTSVWAIFIGVNRTYAVRVITGLNKT